MKLRFNFIIVLLLALTGCPHKPAPHVTISVLGDSLVAGYDIPRDQAFPAMLEAKLKANDFNATVLNQGVSGNTAADGLARLDEVLAAMPDLVILELGANDMLQHIDPPVTTQNLAAIIERLKAAKIAVLLTGMRASPLEGLEYKAPFDMQFPLLAEKEGVPLYPYFLEGIALEPKYNLPDRLHPNPEGVKVLVENIYPSVTRAIKALPGHD